MTKSIASYPASMRKTVIERRMREYDAEKGNGCGVLAAFDAQNPKPKKVTLVEAKQDADQ